jgi:hypothetical protein
VVNVSLSWDNYTPVVHLIITLCQLEFRTKFAEHCTRGKRAIYPSAIYGREVDCNRSVLRTDMYCTCRMEARLNSSQSETRSYRRDRLSLRMTCTNQSGNVAAARKDFILPIQIMYISFLCSGLFMALHSDLHSSRHPKACLNSSRVS